MRTAMMLLATAALLAACATTPPPYQPAARDGAVGFADSAIEENRFRVSYTGRSSDSLQAVEDLALLRAAELTLERGFDWFQIVNRSADGSTGRDGSGVSVGIGVGAGSYGTSTSVGIGIGTGASTRRAAPTVSLEIFAGSGAMPDEGYDANEVSMNLRAQYLSGGI